MSSVSSSLYTQPMNTDIHVRAARSTQIPTDTTHHKFTVKQEDLADVLDFFLDAANWNRVTVKQESLETSVGDYGGGQGTYSTINFSFVPDNADGTFSPGYLNKIKSAKRMFEGRMKSAGINNYAPTE